MLSEMEIEVWSVDYRPILVAVIVGCSGVALHNTAARLLRSNGYSILVSPHHSFSLVRRVPFFKIEPHIEVPVRILFCEIFAILCILLSLVLLVDGFNNWIPNEDSVNVLRQYTEVLYQVLIYVPTAGVIAISVMVYYLCTQSVFVTDWERHIRQSDTELQLKAALKSAANELHRKPAPLNGVPDEMQKTSDSGENSDSIQFDRSNRPILSSDDEALLNSWIAEANKVHPDGSQADFAWKPPNKKLTVKKTPGKLAIKR